MFPSGRHGVLLDQTEFLFSPHACLFHANLFSIKSAVLLRRDDADRIVVVFIHAPTEMGFEVRIDG